MCYESLRAILAVHPAYTAQAKKAEKQAENLQNGAPVKSGH
jgi:hypothetical protein